MRAVEDIKTITSIPAQRARKILNRLFLRGKKTKFKLISLDTSDFYSFIINNIKMLKQEFREIMAKESGKQLQLAMTGQAKTVTFTLPESELYKFSFVKQIKPMAKNVYAGYTTEFVTAETRKVHLNGFLRNFAKAVIQSSGFTKMVIQDSSISLSCT